MTIDVFSRGNETADGNSANGSWTTGELLLADDESGFAVFLQAKRHKFTVTGAADITTRRGFEEVVLTQWGRGAGSTVMATGQCTGRFRVDLLNMLRELHVC